MQDDFEIFNKESSKNIKAMGNDVEFEKLNQKWVVSSIYHKYSYNFTWLGLPIVQYPQDIMAMQEIIWTVKPDVIIETGVARGGSILFYASMLELLENNGIIFGIDIDIRQHNRKRIEAHPLYKKGRVKLLEGSSTDENILKQLKNISKDRKVLVVLDSMHTHEHVLKELKMYSQLVTIGSYLVAFDTVVGKCPDSFFSNRPWGKKNNPKTAVNEFLENNGQFIIDESIDAKILISASYGGYLKKIKN